MYIYVYIDISIYIYNIHIYIYIILYYIQNRNKKNKYIYIYIYINICNILSYTYVMYKNVHDIYICKYIYHEQDIYFLTSYILVSSKPLKTETKPRYNFLRNK